MGRDAEERGEKRRERRETMTQPQQHCDHECVCPDYKASHSENGEDECYGDPDPCSLSCYHRSHPYQSERDKVLDDVDKILNCRTELMEELFEELRDPAVAKHSLQQIEIIRSRVNDLRDMKAGEP